MANWENCCQFLIKLNIHLCYDLGIPPLNIFSREINTYVHTNTCTSMCIAALSIIAINWNNPNVLQNVNKQIMVYPCNGILLSNTNGPIDQCSNTGELPRETKKRKGLHRKKYIQFHLYEVQEQVPLKL